MEKTNTNFRIRAYSKTELALIYKPNLCEKRARRLLTSWIRRNKELTQELLQNGATATTRIYTPRQVKTIVKYIGEP